MSEPKTTMVAHVFDNGGVLIASISPFACAGDDVDDFEMHEPKGLGLWLWRDTGSEPIMPTEFDEDGGVRWSGDWVRPDHEQAIALSSGVMPWSKQTVASAIMAERDMLIDRVRRLEDQLLDIAIANTPQERAHRLACSAVSAFGIEPQLRQVQEEAGELVAAVNAALDKTEALLEFGPCQGGEEGHR